MRSAWIQESLDELRCVENRGVETILPYQEAVTHAEDDAELGLSEAATESGYSSDHLRRLHRLGKLPAIEKDGICTFTRAIYQGSQPRQGCHDTIPLRTLGGFASRGSSSGEDFASDGRRIFFCSSDLRRKPAGLASRLPRHEQVRRDQGSRTASGLPFFLSPPIPNAL